jgi:hypothetical protein
MGFQQANFRTLPTRIARHSRGSRHGSRREGAALSGSVASPRFSLSRASRQAPAGRAIRLERFGLGGGDELAEHLDEALGLVQLREVT